MNPLKTRLDHLEASLQNLIEGSLARLLPGHPLQNSAMQRSLLPKDLTARLLAALQAGAQAGPDGSLEAPEQLLLSAEPSLAKALLANPELIGQWQQHLQQAGVRAGLRFRCPLRLNLQADQRLQAGEIRIQMPGSPADGETQDFHPTPHRG